ncbi:MAG: phosphoglycerate dehydrogenase [Legionellales bacterium]|jgi:D-3-phosphoglycerate dehydrogenase
MSKFIIKTYNTISPLGLAVFKDAGYVVDPQAKEPDAILLRSHVLSAEEVPQSVKVIARAGAGVNNVPVAALSARGLPVLNTPGANANAVKELTLAGLLLSARHICDAWAYTQTLTGDKAEFNAAVEKNKSQFKGIELKGRTLGVVGLGAIGVKVANAARAIGMHVIAYDPHISVQRAWDLSSSVKQAYHLRELLEAAEFISIHVPLIPETKNLFNAALFADVKPNTVLLNFSRQEIVEEAAVIAALDNNQLRYYVSDFPSPNLQNHKKAITLPHLGASTLEAEDNCAVMAAEQIRDYLEYGHIINAVNFPNVEMPKRGAHRITIANLNVPNMVAQISNQLAGSQLNIIDMINKSRDNLACTVIDVDSPIPNELLKNIHAIEGVLNIRVLS